MEVNVEYKQPRVAEIVEVDGSRLVQNLAPVFRLPFVECNDGAMVVCRFRLAMLPADNPAVAFAFRPEVDAGDVLGLVLDFKTFRDDIAVAEPKRSGQLTLFEEVIVEEAPEDLLFRDFRRALKARAMFYRMPIQIGTANLFLDSDANQDEKLERIEELVFEEEE